MVHLVDIHRHPVKGWTPESLDRVRVEAGAGLPFDRHFAFASGRQSQAPRPGGWVPAQTFLQLTYFPELAAFRSALDEDGHLTLTAPDGSSARARVGDPDGFGEADILIRRYFEAGPFGAPTLVEQLPGHGHFDFSDTAVSIINLASVRAVGDAAGRSLERERFRGNLYVDGLPPWAEFGWPGRCIRIGDVEIEVLRPVKRCAMTSTEPGTGLRAMDLPAIMNQAFGHIFCGVYGRIVTGGELATGSALTCGAETVLDPYGILPERVAPLPLWPRPVRAEALDHGLVKFTAEQPGWPLLEARSGQVLNVLAQVPGDPVRKAKIVEGGPDGYLCRCEGPFPADEPVLVNGPAAVRR